MTILTNHVTRLLCNITIYHVVSQINKVTVSYCIIILMKTVKMKTERTNTQHLRASFVVCCQPLSMKHSSTVNGIVLHTQRAKTESPTSYMYHRRQLPHSCSDVHAGQQSNTLAKMPHRTTTFVQQINNPHYNSYHEFNIKQLSTPSLL